MSHVLWILYYNSVNGYEKTCGSVEGGVDSVWLLWCGCVFWTVKPALIFLRLTVTAAIKRRPFFSPHSCLGRQQYLQVDSHGWLFDLLSSSFSPADNWVPRLPVGHYSLFPFLSPAIYYVSHSLFTCSSGFILTAGGHHQPGHNHHWSVHLEKVLIEACILFTSSEGKLQLMWPLGDSIPHRKSGLS